VRAKAAELLLSAAEAKTTVSEYLIVNNGVPDNSFRVQNNSSRMVSLVTWGDGSLRIDGNRSNLGATISLQLQPALNGGRIDWSCQPLAGTRFVPSSCQ
jgi:hypothetical protein